MLVFPVPGGHHRIIEARRPAATILPIAPSGPVRCSCPTTSSSDLGRSRSASGALAAGASGARLGTSWSANRSALAFVIMCRGENARTGLSAILLRYILDASKGERLCIAGNVVRNNRAIGRGG